MPAEGYAVFWRANEWGQSVRKLLTGRDTPMLYLEWKLWQRYEQARAKYEQQQSKKRGR